MGYTSICTFLHSNHLVSFLFNDLTAFVCLILPIVFFFFDYARATQGEC